MLFKVLICIMEYHFLTVKWNSCVYFLANRQRAPTYFIYIKDGLHRENSIPLPSHASATTRSTCCRQVMVFGCWGASSPAGLEEVWGGRAGRRRQSTSESGWKAVRGGRWETTYGREQGTRGVSMWTVMGCAGDGSPGRGSQKRWGCGARAGEGRNN